MRPEDDARKIIDRMLEESGWTIQDHDQMNLNASIGSGIAVREFPLSIDSADYALFMDEAPVGVVEVKKIGFPLSGVTTQSEKYLKGLHEKFPNAPRRPSLSYETTGIETLFADRHDPDYRSRHVFTFHRPEILKELLKEPRTLRGRLKEIPKLDYTNLWKCQTEAITRLEKSFSRNNQRALIQMATGSGKTFTAVTFVYRLIKFAKAGRVLFLVDRANLGRQALREFQQYETPDDGRKFTELYNVQHLQSQNIHDVSVVISTVQRMYSILKGESVYDDEDEEFSEFEKKQDDTPIEIRYNKDVPISKFDFIIIDECHRSIYNKWRQVLDYFDAFLIGLTATPSKNTIGFFSNNQVMEYLHERAVADKVNVNYEVYRIKTKIAEEGSTIKAEVDTLIEKRDKMTRKSRYEKLDDDLQYSANQLDRDVLAPDQIRLVIKTFKDSLREMFPDRNIVPKTLVFAKDDNHAEEITRTVREVFAKGNEFCQKITYKTTGEKPEELIKGFRNSPNPRIAVTVDMIATGTDIKPLECIVFMRDVKSKNYFDQMKGRGTRVINTNDLKAVTSDAKEKDHFVIVDAVGVCEHMQTDTYSLNRKKGVSFEQLMQKASEGRADEDDLKSLAYRLSRLDTKISKEDGEEISKVADGNTIPQIVHKILDGVDTDIQVRKAREKFKTDNPTSEQVEESAKESVRDACRLFYSARLRNIILEIKRRNEIIVDDKSQDELINAEFTKEESRKIIERFDKFIEKNKDELAALNIIYSKPYRMRDITFNDIKELTNAIKMPPYNLTPGLLWRAYQRLDKSKVKNNPVRALTDLISIVRYSSGKQDMLAPYQDIVDEKFQKWLSAQESSGRRFTPEQRDWLVMIKDHIASSAEIAPEDMEYSPFKQKGGEFRMYKIFGEDYKGILNELHSELSS